MNCDLHCHTLLSDGSLGIDELISLSVANGVDTIAITDHDTFVATVRAKTIGERKGVTVLPATELSAIDGETGRPMHILCYLPEHPDKLEGICKNNTVARNRSTMVMMTAVARKINMNDFTLLTRRCASGATCLYKQHIMRALVECGLAESVYGAMHDKLFTPGGEDSVFQKINFADVREVLDAIHMAEGIAVLAHPALYDSEDALDRLVEMGLDGIEVWHPTADAATSERLADYAAKHKLLMTGGSDFHGAYSKSAVTVGAYGTPSQQLKELLGYKSKKKRQARRQESAAEQ